MGELFLNLTNCESSITDHFLFEDDLIIENFVYTDGEITSCTFKIWSTSQRLGNTYDLISMGMLSEDKKSITFDFQKFNNAYQNGRRDASWWNSWDYNQYTITAKAVQTKNVILDLKNCVIPSAPIPHIDDWTGIITIVADTGYIFNYTTTEFMFFNGGLPYNYDLKNYISPNGREINIDLADLLVSSGKTASELSRYDNQKLEIYAISDEGYLVDKINYTLENCSADTDERITNRDDYINIVADDGFVIDYLTIGFSIPRGGKSEYNILNLFLSSDKKQANIYLPDLYKELPLSPNTIANSTFHHITAKAIEHVTVDDDMFKSNSFIKTYVGDFDTLHAISILIYGSDMGGADIMSAIQSIYSIPFKVDESSIVPTKRLMFFGSVESDVLANLTRLNTLTVDFGIVEVPVLYNSLFDYKDTTCFIHLPFISSPIEVDVYKVVGHRVNAKLLIDLYTGEGTYLITSDSVDNQILIKQVVKVGYEIPIINNHNNVIIGTLEKYTYNLDYEFKIELNRNKPIITDSKSNLIYDSINNYTGLVKVNDLELNSIASFREKQEIDQLLNQGILIK